MLDTLALAKYRLVLAPCQMLFLPPYKGSALRGGFGYALRQGT
jgi:hypothetical protein